MVIENEVAQPLSVGRNRKTLTNYTILDAINDRREFPLIGVEDAAYIVGLSTVTLDSQATRDPDWLPYLKIGRRRLYRPRDIAAFLDRQPKFGTERVKSA